VSGEFIYNGSVANKALELIGKELGMFIDRKEVGGPNEFARPSPMRPCCHAANAAVCTGDWHLAASTLTRGIE
jgi:hypothetical protein